MRRFSLLSLCWLAGFSTMAVAENDPNQQAIDEQALKTVQLGTEGPALLDFFKKRTITDADRSQVDELISQLGDEEFENREKAKRTLIDRGPAVIRPLTEALKSSDLEVVHRAEECLRVLNRTADPAVAAAAIRLLSRKKPEGTLEALFAYLPFARDEIIVDELRESLAGLAVREGKPEKAVLAALDDKSALRRAAAAEALARSGSEEVRVGLKKFLKDKESTVRLWTAYGFLERREPDAVPTLIDLLGSVSREEAFKIEDTLARIAGEKSPSVALGTDEAARKKCVEAWQKWWDDDGRKLDLAKLDLNRRLLGYTLLVGTEINKGRGGINGKVQEIGSDGKVRWEITGLKYAIDAHVIGHDRVLIVEYSGRSVTERDFQGEVLWRYDLQVPQFPLSAQRLSNGNTFIACRNGLLEVNRDGKEVFNIPRNTSDVFSAQKLRNGQIAVATNTGAIQFIDMEGKELKSLSPGMQPIFGGGFDVLPNGRVLVPLLSQQKVVELDADGKVAWEAEVQQPSHATRLPNGHTLVTSMSTQDVIEFDQSGKEVWRHKADSLRLLKARRR